MTNFDFFFFPFQLYGTSLDEAWAYVILTHCIRDVSLLPLPIMGGPQPNAPIYMD